jgi:hypothetical protein
VAKGAFFWWSVTFEDIRTSITLPFLQLLSKRKLSFLYYINTLKGVRESLNTMTCMDSGALAESNYF